MGRRGCSGGFRRIRQVESFWVLVEDIPRLARQLERGVNGVQRQIASAAAADTEGADFAHIDPDAVDGDLLIVRHDLILPPSVRRVLQEIREHGVSRPDGAVVDRAIGVQE